MFKLSNDTKKTPTFYELLEINLCGNKSKYDDSDKIILIKLSTKI